MTHQMMLSVLCFDMVYARQAQFFHGRFCGCMAVHEQHEQEASNAGKWWLILFTQLQLVMALRDGTAVPYCDGRPSQRSINHPI